MSKKKKQRKLIRDSLSWWRDMLGLGYFNIDIYFTDYFQSSGRVAARTVCDWRYQEAEITFSLSEIKDLDKESIDRVIVHELMHIFLDEMSSDSIDHEERVATQLQKAFMWVKGADK